MLGIAPFEARDGDLVVIFHGSQMPFVLRYNGDGTYNLIGDFYVHGIHGRRRISAIRTGKYKSELCS